MLLAKEKLKKIPWIQLFVESVLVVLSVVFALALNNWNQDRINEKLAQQALINIVNEIKSNREKVINAIEYNTKLIEAFKNDPYARGSMNPAFIHNSAWQTALASGAIAYLNYDIISVLTEINEFQEDYKDIIDIGTQAIYIGNLQIADSEKRRSYHPLINTVYDFLYREKRLLKSYDKALKIIENEIE